MQNVTAVFLATRKNNAEILRILLQCRADAAEMCDMSHVVRTRQEQMIGTVLRNMVHAL